MLDAIDRGESPTILGDGSEAFDFVSVEDCAQANVCAMKSNATDSFYNVGDWHPNISERIGRDINRAHR